MRDYELQSHKKSDSIKWTIVFILIFILFIGMGAMFYIGAVNRQEDVPKDESTAEIVDYESNQVYAMPKVMTFTAEALSASETDSVDVRIEAYVYPANAANREIDYSVAWGIAPTHGNEPVANYLTVTPDDDGSRLATVTCKKAFGGDKIIITATTRDGGYTANCTVSFSGIASAMRVTSPTLSTVYDSKRGTYYELGTNKTYTFDINLDNAFGYVGKKDLTVTLGGSGSLYFGTTFMSGDWAVAQFQDMELRNLSSMADRFITSATISGNTLTVKTGTRPVENYYSSIEPDENFIGEYVYDRYVYEDELGLTVGSRVDDDYEGKAKANTANLPSCYFTLTIKDNVSNLSQEIKIWVVTSVNGVAVSETALEF